MYAIIFRDTQPVIGTRTHFETDDFAGAVALLELVVMTPGVDLIDYSPSLDGSIDDLLSKISDQSVTAVA